MTSPPGRILALDLGSVRVGVAVSDPLGITAQPLEPLRTVGPRKDLRAIADLVSEYEAETVVIGLPLHLSGAEGPASEAARAFAAKLEKRIPSLRVELWDERLTTMEAERMLVGAGVRRERRREVIDSLAAVLILQGYLGARASSANESSS